MARGKWITEFERDCIRIGVYYGASGAAIARFLGRTKGGVRNHIERMRDEGTLGNLPLDFVKEEIGRHIIAHEVR
jgi:IS30 family transposase